MDSLDIVFMGVSLEDANAEIALTGQSKKEIEYEIYGKVVNLNDLKKAAKTERQDQWGIPIFKTDKNYSAGTVRVRQIDGGKVELTTKVKRDSDEAEIETSQDMFDHFRKLADQGLIKVRHYFPVDDNFTYEVDAFFNTAGQFSEWVKIDLEMPEGVETLDTLPDLPFEMTDIRVIAPGPKKPEDLAFVRELFEKYFNVANQFLDKLPVSESAAIVLQAEAKRDAAQPQAVLAERFHADLKARLGQA